jgi:hypothetical protein
VSITTVPSGGCSHNGEATFQRVGQGRKNQAGVGTPAFLCPLLPPVRKLASRWRAQANGPSGTEEKAVEIVLGNAAVLTTVLKKKAGQGGSDHAVLIPLGMVVQETAHAMEQHLGHLGLQGHAGGGAPGIAEASGGEIGAGRRLLTAWITLRRPPRIHPHGALFSCDCAPLRHRRWGGVKGMPNAQTQPGFP